MTQERPAIASNPPEPLQNGNGHQATEVRPPEAGNGDILELVQVSSDRHSADGNAEQNSEHASNAGRSSIPDLDHLDEARGFVTRKTKREIHLITPLTMIATLFVGLIMAIAHHLYYDSLVRRETGGSYKQQQTRL
jgi:hypothetical protein